MAKKYKYRQGYFNQIEPYIGDSLIKVLIGQRRVGKSYILFQLMDEIKKLYADSEILYINKEEYEFDFIKNYSDLISYVESKRKTKTK